MGFIYKGLEFRDGCKPLYDCAAVPSLAYQQRNQASQFVLISVNFSQNGLIEGYVVINC